MIFTASGLFIPGRIAVLSSAGADADTDTQANGDGRADNNIAQNVILADLSGSRSVLGNIGGQLAALHRGCRSL